MSVSGNQVELSILVVTHGNPELTRSCLRSVLDQTSGVTHEVIVIDNASPDATPDVIREEFPSVRLFEMSQNLGFARGNNLAAQHARGTHLILLNPDTIVLDRALERLLAFARSNPQGGIYGGRTLRPDGELDPRSCWGAPSLWSLFCFATGLSTAFRRSAVFNPESLGKWRRDSVREVGVVTGCLALVPRSVWQELGGFDESFWMYGEDADLSLRARAKGYRPCITPAATIVHYVGGSGTARPEKLVQICTAKATLMRKHYSPPGAAIALGLLAAGVGLRAVLGKARSVLRRSTTASHWQEAWQQRSRWLSGFPPTAVSSVGPAASQHGS